MRIFIALAFTTLIFTGCPEDPPTSVPDASTDAAAETVADITAETTEDAGPETDSTEPDVPVEVTPDVPVEVTPDVPLEVTPDVPVEVTPDVPVEVTPDAADTDTGATCSSACDCEQGWDCFGGTCQLGVKAVFCCTTAGCPDGESCVNGDGSGGLCNVDTAAEFGTVLFNEVLTDGEVDGDPNGDGDSADSVGDEFVEIVNVGSAAVDMSGWTLVDSTLTLPRHTFAPGATLAAGAAMVVFGGGTAPEDTATATFVVANAADPGFSFGLSLDNTKDSISLLDDEGALVAVFAYGEGAPLAAISDQSYTRDPDLTGPFVGHDAATGSAGALFSPGTTIDGSGF